MDDLRLEMQMYFEQIYEEELKRLGISLVKEFAEFDPTELAVNSAEMIAGTIEHDEELIEFLKERQRNK